MNNILNKFFSWEAITVGLIAITTIALLTGCATSLETTVGDATFHAGWGVEIEHADE